MCIVSCAATSEECFLFHSRQPVRLSPQTTHERFFVGDEEGEKKSRKNSNELQHVYSNQIKNRKNFRDKISHRLRTPWNVYEIQLPTFSFSILYYCYHLPSYSWMILWNWRCNWSVASANEGTQTTAVQFKIHKKTSIRFTTTRRRKRMKKRGNVMWY